MEHILEPIIVPGKRRPGNLGINIVFNEKHMRISFDSGRRHIIDTAKDKKSMAIYQAVQKHPFLSSASPRWRLYNEDIEAKKFIEETKKESDILNLVLDMAKDKVAIRVFAAGLGLLHVAKSSSDIIVKSILVKAKGSPDEVIAAYKDPNREYLQVLYGAYAAGIVKKKFGEYYYEDTSLGKEDAAVAVLKAELPIFKAIKEKVQDYYSDPPSKEDKRKGK